VSREPDHIYNPDNWEWTVPYGEREAILSEEVQDSIGVVRYKTLYEGPEVFAANVPVEFDDDGCPERFEVRWFATREAAEVALAEGEEQDG